LKAWRWTSTSSLASIIIIFKHYWTTLASYWNYAEEQILTSVSRTTWKCS
jgi:hypothetical protein